MQKLRKLLDKAWKNFLDAYEQEENPKKSEGPLIVKISKDLTKAVIYEQEMACFIDRTKNHVFSLEMEFGKPTNFDNIIRKIAINKQL